MPGDPAVVDVLRALAGVLAELRAPWYLFGAQAVVVWGRPRLTGDVDVTTFLPEAATAGFVAAMRRAGFEARVPDVEGFVSRTRVVPLAHAATGIGVDIVLGSPGLEEDFLRTARDVDLGGLRLRVIAPEELVVTKILAGRAKDLDDVRGIVAAQADAFDSERVRSLLGLIETALDRADLVPVFDEQLRTVRGGR